MIQNLIKLSCILIVITLTSSCAVSKNYQFSESRPEGIAAMGIFCGLPHAGSISFIIKPYGKRNTLKNAAESVFLPDLLTAECGYMGLKPMKNQVSLIKLPAGKYQVKTYKVRDGAYELSPVKFKRFIFEVKNHKVTYIGRLAVFQDGEGHRVYLNNAYQEDSPLINEKLPKISSDDYIVNIMKAIP